MAALLKLNQGADARRPVVLSEDVPTGSNPGDRVELAEQATIEALRLLFRERHDTAQTVAKD